MQNKYKICFLLLLLIVICSISVAADNYYEKLPDEVKMYLYNKKETNDLIDAEIIKQKFKKYLYKFDDYHDEIDEELIKIDRKSEKPFMLSTERAIEDVNFLFKLFKYGYAGYQFFGGDKKFNAAKDNIIDDIKQKSVFNRLTTDTFTEILLNNLRFIQDGHFAIANKSVMERYIYFASPRFDFYRDEKGYYTQFQGQKAYLISVNNKDYNDYLKLSINNKGEVVYRLGTLSKQQNIHIKLYVQLKPVNSSEIIDVFTVLIRQDKDFKGKRTPYNVYRIQNIPVIEHRTAIATPGNRKKLEQLAAEAKNFKDEEFIIIDLRDNSGGADMYAADWVKNFTGISPGEGLIASSLVTRTANKLLANSFKYIYDMDIAELEPAYQELLTRTKSGWTEIKYYKTKCIENNNLIIVLIDNGVTSAGESFVKYLMQLSNVIFVGTNTAGVMNFGNVGMCNLPNSRLEIYISKSISLEHDFRLREGKGYFPDFWVNPEEALDLSLKLIDNYFR